MKEKKIEEAARKRLYAFRKANNDGYSSSIIDIESDCLDNFKAGARWAIQEFLKGLWHDKIEIPAFKEDGSRPIIVELYEGYGKYGYSMYSYVRRPDWRYKVFKRCITRWFYVEDLVKKQEGGDE